MNREEAFNRIFDILETNNIVKYTNSYTRTVLISAMVDKKYLIHTRRYLIEQRDTNNEWHIYLLRKYLGLKECPTCNNLFKIAEFYSSKAVCTTCDAEKSKQYRKHNKEKVKQARSKHYENNKEYYKYKNSLNNSRLKQATPKWANLENIAEFYHSKPSSAYTLPVIVDTELTLGEDMVLDTGRVYALDGTVFTERNIENHPRFDNFRFRLERMGYISTGDPDIVIRGFRVNGLIFLEGEIFPTAGQFSNRYAF